MRTFLLTQSRTTALSLFSFSTPFGYIHNKIFIFIFLLDLVFTCSNVNFLLSSHTFCIGCEPNRTCMNCLVFCDYVCARARECERACVCVCVLYSGTLRWRKFRWFTKEKHDKLTTVSINEWKRLSDRIYVDIASFAICIVFALFGVFCFISSTPLQW